MFNIVNAVEKYPDFVPWCKRVITRNVAERVAEYEQFIGFPPLIQEHYTSRVTTLRPNVIHVSKRFSF
jgi:ribosome-associated toxin RatA of RatAB toxin-antitoxin module